jgi:diguanylate cyclase (GGDEF)-like protein
LRLDQLTGLPTRKLLMDRLQQAKILTARDNAYGSVMLIDIDNFKSLNDTHGHDIGDALLKEVARRLSTCVRDLDTAARLGGDEFVVVFVSVARTESEAAALIESLGAKILAVLAQPYRLGSLTYISTVSIGMTLFHGAEASGEELLKQADLAMYKSKDSGRNACRFFDIHMETTVLERATLERELREALADRQFELHYQPQVTANGSLIGAEALVRWNHPKRGTVMPNEFIPLAEETGLILPLGQWVLQTACEQLARWASWPEAATCRMGVNVSARQFQQPDFVDQVVATLERSGARPQQLVLELTESLLVRDVEDVIRKMTLLKAMGVSFALDDFGIGYSSMYYLKRLPLDQLKIDCSFVRHILTDPDDAAIAGMIVTLAQTLQLEVVAEGIETAAQRDFLIASGCHVYQGDFFSPPRPLREFEKFFFERNLAPLSCATA